MEAKQAMKIYNRKPLGGWARSTEIVAGSVEPKDAIGAGFKPRPSCIAREYVLVPTSYQKGFRGRYAKTYYSVWGR